MARAAALMLPLSAALGGLAAGADVAVAAPRAGDEAQGGRADDTQHADYQKYMSSGKGGQGDYRQYMDYHKYVHGGQGGQSDYQQYMDYQKYMKQGGGSQMLIASSDQASAKDCNTTEQLEAWRHDQEKKIKAFTPKAYQNFELEPLQQEYERNLDRIEGKPEHAAPKSAAECKSTRQLKAWRRAQLKSLAVVPKAYRNFAEEPIEKEYKKNLARIHAAERKADGKESGEKEMAVDKTQSEDEKPDDKADQKEATDKKGASGGPAAEAAAPAEASEPIAAHDGANEASDDASDDAHEASDAATEKDADEASDRESHGTSPAAKGAAAEASPESAASVTLATASSSGARVTALLGLCAAVTLGSLALAARRGRGPLSGQEPADAEAPFLRLDAAA